MNGSFITEGIGLYHHPPEANGKHVVSTGAFNYEFHKRCEADGIYTNGVSNPNKIIHHQVFLARVGQFWGIRQDIAVLLHLLAEHSLWSIWLLYEIHNYLLPSVLPHSII